MESRRHPRWLTPLLLGALIALLALLAACGSRQQDIAGSGKQPAPKAASGQEAKATGSGAAKQADVKSVVAPECSGCHEMLPEITTWQVSSHSKISCTVCHPVNPDQFKRQHESNAFSMPVKLSAPVKSQVCEQCHSPNRVATPSGDLIIPHDRHAKQGIDCLRCHANVVHASIASRNVTVKGEYRDLKAWTPEVAQKVALVDYVRPSMWTCLNCHKTLKINTACAACHTSIPGLPSHEQAVWKTDHGINGRTDINSCIKCHATPGGPTKLATSTGDATTDFARVTEFCFNCHQQKPTSHQGEWLPAHPQRALARGRQNCYACHDTHQPAAETNVTSTYCNECHWFGKAAETPPKPAEPPKK